MRLIRLAIALVYITIVVMIAASPLLGRSRPYAPLSILPEPEPITITVISGAEKEQWLREAASAFEASGASVDGAPLRIELQTMSSGKAKDALLSGQIRPDVWSPASDLWIELLNEAHQRSGQVPLIAITGDDAPAPLVLTPLVLVAWAERATVLRGDQQLIWRNLESTIRDGWAAKGHPEWGNAAWGHTTPTSSNSGLQALLLMAYDYHGKTGGLTIADVEQPAFGEWLRSIESGASFAESSADLMNDMIAFGPAKYSVVASYENLALQQLPNARSRGQNLVLIYPEANIWSNHPYALVTGNWVTPAKREGARQFRQFLLSPAQQEKALQFGFRPAVPTISIAGSTSPFTVNAGAGVQLDVPALVETPSGDVINALLTTWTRSVQR